MEGNSFKKAKLNWTLSYENQLQKAERSEIRAFYNFFKGEYQKGYETFLRSGQISTDGLFKTADLIELYQDLYENIGLRFANWYAKNFDSLVEKQIDVTGNDSIWRQVFRSEAAMVAGGRVTLVSGTKKKTLTKIITGLMMDAEFQSMGADAKARVFRRRFDDYSQKEAVRLVRTESTNAANQATMTTAKDMFGEEGLDKEWMTAMDGRERLSHNQMNGTIIDFKEKFNVGITKTKKGGQIIIGYEEMDRPGDPNATAENVINCRCSIAPIPKERPKPVERPVVEQEELAPEPKPEQPKPRRTPKPREPFKSVRAANKYAREQLGIKYADFGGVPIEVINEMIDQFEAVRRINPKLKMNFLGGTKGYKKVLTDLSEEYYDKVDIKEVGFIRESNRKLARKSVKANMDNSGSNDPNIAGWFDPSKDQATPIGIDVEFSRLRGFNYNLGDQDWKYEQFRNYRNNWWSSNGDRGMHVVAHEFGHALDNSGEFFNSIQFKNAIRDYYTTDPLTGRQVLDRDLIEKSLSRYAVSYENERTTFKEIIAEAWAEYNCAAEPRPLAKRIGKAIEEYFKNLNKAMIKKSDQEKTSAEEEKEIPMQNEFFSPPMVIAPEFREEN